MIGARTEASLLTQGIGAVRLAGWRAHYVGEQQGDDAGWHKHPDTQTRDAATAPWELPGVRSVTGVVEHAAQIDHELGVDVLVLLSVDGHGL